MRFPVSQRRRGIHAIVVRCALVALLCQAGTAGMAQERWWYSGLRTAQDDPPAAELPPPESSTTSNRCQPPDDLPQALLTVDIQPVDRPGQTDLNPADLPEECPAPILAGVPAVYMGFQPASDCNWPIWPGAQFCHRPLYFEEVCLERCGYTQCCQPAVSAAHFYGTALLLPLKFCQQCPGSCVCTPPAF